MSRGVVDMRVQRRAGDRGAVDPSPACRRSGPPPRPACPRADDLRQRRSAERPRTAVHAVHTVTTV